VKRTYRLLHGIGLTPWANQEIPAALRELVTGDGAIPPGVALDLGCGTGQHARFLADLGWRTTAVDFIATAVTRARRHDRTGRVTWRVADVTRPGQVDPQGTLGGQVRLVLDVGCLHGLSTVDRVGWAATIAHVASTTATLLVRAAPPGRRGIGPGGIAADDITELLGSGWRLAAHDGGWYRYDRRDGS
jgi:SAM-dependent methyltransferase